MISKYFSMELLFFIFSLSTSFCTCWRFLKRLPVQVVLPVLLSFYTVWFGTSWTVPFWASFWESHQRLFVSDEAFEHLSSSFVSFNQECTFPMKLKIMLSSSSSQSPLLLIWSSSKYCFHSTCAATTNFKMSLNCENLNWIELFTSHFISRSSMVPLFLRSLEYSVCLLF